MQKQLGEGVEWALDSVVMETLNDGEKQGMQR